jgi:hypothetical protein
MGDLALWVIMTWVVFFITPALMRIADSLKKIADR